jgi:hypothetical protein
MLEAMLDLRFPWLTMKNTAFWDMTLCSLIEVYCSFRGTYCHHLQGQRVSQARSKQIAVIYLLLLLGCLVYSLMLKMAAVHSSDMSDFYQTTWHHSPEDSNLLENSGLLGCTA